MSLINAYLILIEVAEAKRKAAASHAGKQSDATATHQLTEANQQREYSRNEG